MRSVAACSGLVVLLGWAVGARMVAAQATARENRDEVSQLDSVAARSDTLFDSISHAIELRGGGVLVWTDGGRRVVLFDPAFAAVLATMEMEPVLGFERGRGLISWRGDSTLVVNAAEQRLEVVDPLGLRTREIPIPTAALTTCLGSAAGGTPSVDASGRIVCQMPQAVKSGAILAGKVSAPQVEDSAAVVRVGIGSWSVDTIGFVRAPAWRMAFSGDSTGTYVLAPVIDPVPLVDEWVVLPDGSLAVVRSEGDRIDWFDAEGRQLASSAVDFVRRPWGHAEKVALVDSVRAELARVRLASGNASIVYGPPEEFVDKSKLRRLSVFRAHAINNAAAAAAYAGRLSAPALHVLGPEDLPDTLPPFAPGDVRADRAGNLWIRTRATEDGRAIYDVLNRRGQRIARIAAPARRTIIGFGAEGSVFMAEDTGGGIRLERAFVRLR